ncbi:MAG: response regulator [bacterium]
MGNKQKTSINSEIDVHYADDDIDDIELFSDAVAMIAEKGGEKITLSVYNNGESLLGTINSIKTYDSIIFLDINMPAKDGIEVLTEIRNNEEFASLPVVMFSTSSDKSIVEQCWEKGANLYAVKPSSFSELIQTIEDIVRIKWIEQKLSMEHFVYNTDSLKNIF